MPVINSLLAFFIWHFLVYPSSNGYNSYMDRDEGPVGGLRKPMLPTRQLYKVSVIMDLVAVFLALFIGAWFSLGIIIYIIASRLYSFRGIRLKQFPLAGFLTVFIFQGAHVYLFTVQAVSGEMNFQQQWLPALTASLLIGALYPLTQIYQHQDDKNDGVITLSYILGKRGSFIFSGILFISATLCMYLLFERKNELNNFFFFTLCMFPVVLFFLYWMSRVWRNEAFADFRHAMIMSTLATSGTTIFFVFLNFYHH